MRRFDFHEMNLIPKKCIAASRSLCDTRATLGAHTFRLPVVPANMQCVIDDMNAQNLAQNNYFYIHHRFHNHTLSFAERMKHNKLPVSISIGVNKESEELLDTLLKKEIVPDYITIDIAHGHSESMRDTIRMIRGKYKDSKVCPYIIAGNVCTPEAVCDLEAWGADAIKCGVAPGSSCTTYMMTGFGSRNIQASCIQACAKARKNPYTKIIADGGIKEPGDIAKALALGADFVMIGGMFSGLTDSPGMTITGTDGKLYKEYFGSASEHQSGKKNRIEGTKKWIPLKDHGILQEMKYIEECLQSAISYGGGTTLECLKTLEFV